MKTTSKATKDAGYIHTGHRQKLRARFLTLPEALSDTDLVELGLMFVIPRCDVRPIAKRLMDRFQSILGILQAPVEELVSIKGLQETSAAFLKFCLELTLRAKKLEVIQRPILENWDNLVDYCHLNYAHKTEEELHLLILDAQLYLLKDELIQKGGKRMVHIPVEVIAQRAIVERASHIILVHNHPSGEAIPSEEDITATRLIKAVLRPLHIDIFDSLIIGKESVTSLMREGLL